MVIDANNVQYFDVDYDNIHIEALPTKVLEIIELVNRKVAAKESLDELMNFLFDETQEIFSCERIALAFVREEGRRVVSQWCRASYKPTVLGVGYAEDLHKSTLRKVIERRKVRLINDLVQYVLVYPDSTSSQLLLEEGVRSSMTCPLVVEGKTVGLLFYNSRQTYTFGEQQVQQLLAIAERLSQAVEHAYRIDELAQANTNYNELLSFISHELKSPLSSIIMDTTLLSEGYLGELQPKQREKLKRIYVKADYLLNLVRDYLDLARIEGGNLRLDIQPDVDIERDIVRPAASLVEVQLEERGMRLDILKFKRPIIAQCDPTLLKIAVTNLLSNAVKYGREKGVIRVYCGLRDGRLVIRVENEGIGWSKSQQHNLFHKFSRLDSETSRRQSGTGVGLYATWRIIQLHRGAIKAEAQHGQWARFTINIPQPLTEDDVLTQDDGGKP